MGKGQYARLPEHYKRRAIEHLYGEKEDVHEVRDKRKFIVNHETGVWYESHLIGDPLMCIFFSL